MRSDWKRSNATSWCEPRNFGHHRAIVADAQLTELLNRARYSGLPQLFGSRVNFVER